METLVKNKSKNISVICLICIFIIGMFISGCSNSQNEIKSTNENKNLDNKETSDIDTQIENIEIKYKSSLFGFEYGNKVEGKYPYFYPTGEIIVDICNYNDNEIILSSMGNSKFQQVCFKGSCKNLPIGIEISFNNEDIVTISESLIETLSDFSDFRTKTMGLKLNPQECIEETLSFHKEFKTNLLHQTNPSKIAYENANYYFYYKEDKNKLNEYNEKYDVSLTKIQSSYNHFHNEGIKLCQKTFIGKMYKADLDKCIELDSLINWAVELKDTDVSICDTINDDNCVKSFEKSGEEWVTEFTSFFDSASSQAKVDGNLVE